MVSNITEARKTYFISSIVDLIGLVDEIKAHYHEAVDCFVVHRFVDNDPLADGVFQHWIFDFANGIVHLTELADDEMLYYHETDVKAQMDVLLVDLEVE